eukprot:2010357-Rhodomonas_salina.1
MPGLMGQQLTRPRTRLTRRKRSPVASRSLSVRSGLGFPGAVSCSATFLAMAAGRATAALSCSSAAALNPSRLWYWGGRGAARRASLHPAHPSTSAVTAWPYLIQVVGVGRRALFNRVCPVGVLQNADAERAVHSQCRLVVASHCLDCRDPGR